MIIVNERIDYTDIIAPYHVRICTTNSFIKKDGSVVMGRGNAKAMSTAHPEIPKHLGNAIDHLEAYYYLQFEWKGLQQFGIFQVKYGWYDKADLSLIQGSCDSLRYTAKLNPDITYHLPFPGIGNGKLDRDVVYEIIKELPDNVKVYETC